MFGKPGYGREDVEVLERRLVYQGFFRLFICRVRHRLFAGGWSRPLARELFARPRAVGVLPYDPAADRVALVEQFRIGALERPAGPWLLELVAGLAGPGESDEEVARRELAEEAGLAVERLVPIAELYLSPGGSDERIALYCGIGRLSGDGTVHGLAGEGEDIRLHLVSREAALAALDAGQCDNAPLTIALQWLALHHREIVEGRR
ncbi:MAG: ADP-ribose pyrophosphatase [Porticoccaceae bacterium]|nr:MAG: ADP-ribose pyrophosphatase [Porticoccaceae bacterium]